ncbi:MAG: repressor LexA [Acidobacteria bacterium]|nr:repressor LexA [Acidobacteriota bacterium]
MAYTPPGETRRRVYEFLRQRLSAGEPPTVREVQAKFGFKAVESARAQLEALVREGLLVKAPGRSRGYRLPESARPAPPPRMIPLLGAVQAGNLTEAILNPAGHVPVERSSKGKAEELFALRVQGESMTGAGIFPGDIVIVRRQPSAESGDIVVALLEDEATVKRLRRHGDRWVLRPENPAFVPIVVGSSALRVLGKVIEVRRYLE